MYWHGEFLSTEYHGENGRNWSNISCHICRTSYQDKPRLESQYYRPKGFPADSFEIYRPITAKNEIFSILT